MTDKTKPIEFNPPQNMEDMWAIIKPVIDKVDQSIVTCISEKINKPNKPNIGRGLFYPLTFNDLCIEQGITNIPLSLVSELELGSLAKQLIDEKCYHFNSECDTAKVVNIYLDGRTATKYILDNNIVYVESRNNVSTILSIDLTIKNIVLNKESYDKVSINYNVFDHNHFGKNEITYTIKYRTLRNVDDHTEVYSYESISKDKLIVDYKLTNIDYNYKNIDNWVPVFNKEFGYMTMLCCDDRYALVYSSSADMYRAGCRVFTREEAIAHWSAVASQDTATLYSQEDYDEDDIATDKLRRDRAKLFLEAIHKHNPGS